ncbi:helix-turn-helix transcriptional regulator [Leptolyngbya sp. AN03gr2]|uniref:helix-turn-helix transcriptional regulator n=1 Tax=unclassified Leptolyngbya TaxID=2650499 RepID=UPI003D314DB6
MTSVLSDTTCEDFWQVSRQQARQVDPEDKSDRIAECPSMLGKGYKRDIELRNGIDLTFHRYQLNENLVVNCVPPGETDCLEWVFTLSSGFQYPNGVQIHQGQHLLAGLVSSGGSFEGLAQTTTVEVDIHLEPQRFQALIGDQIDRLPIEIHRMLARDETIPFSSIRTITPAMQLALQQMLECPFQGVVKQMYLESKSIEVLALWVDQVCSSDESFTTPRVTEVERIHHAKDILLKQIDNPPSLLALARQVGLNDCTLKREFKQVFGTTVFGYLHQSRMQQARSLLLDQQYSVTEVARRVGYRNLCAFSTAFRKTFGVSPKTLQKSSV